jgi:hypothetical protein
MPARGPFLYGLGRDANCSDIRWQALGYYASSSNDGPTADHAAWNKDRVGSDLDSFFKLYIAGQIYARIQGDEIFQDSIVANGRSNVDVHMATNSYVGCNQGPSAKNRAFTYGHMLTHPGAWMNQGCEGVFTNPTDP